MNRRLIKKYANRRLYDTVLSKHVTVANIRELIVSGVDVQVVDDTSGDDITRQLLLQIVTDQEPSGEHILTETLLTQLIRFYGNPLQGMMSTYLQKSVDTFLGQQQIMQDQMKSMMAATPLDTMQDMVKQNLNLWDSMLGGDRSKRGDDENT